MSRRSMQLLQKEERGRKKCKRFDRSPTAQLRLVGAHCRVCTGQTTKTLPPSLNYAGASVPGLYPPAPPLRREA